MKKERGITIIGAADIGKTTLAELAGKITPIVVNDEEDSIISFKDTGRIDDYMVNLQNIPDNSAYLDFDGKTRNEAKHKATCKANRKKRKKKNKKRR